MNEESLPISCLDLRRETATRVLLRLKDKLTFNNKNKINARILAGKKNEMCIFLLEPAEHCAHNQQNMGAWSGSSNPLLAFAQLSVPLLPMVQLFFFFLLKMNDTVVLEEPQFS